MGPKSLIICGSAHSYTTGEPISYRELDPLPLNVNHAWINGHWAGVNIGPYGSLTLGPSPVRIGSWDGRKNVFGIGGGLSCEGYPWAPASISDLGISTVEIDAQYSDVEVGDFCQTSLVHGPILGRSPDAGYNSCPVPMYDYFGLGLARHASASLGSPSDPATIQCQYYDGIEISEANDAQPLALFTGMIRNAVCYGVEAHAGYVAIFSSDITQSGNGLWIDQTATANLDGFYFQSAPSSRISCISVEETEGTPHRMHRFTRCFSSWSWWDRDCQHYIVGYH